MATNRQTFKSQRAAKIAFGRAERAWHAARDARNNAHLAAVTEGVGEDYRQTMAPYEAAEDAARDAARRIYDAATAQGHWVDSYDFGHNPTRDLIRANMD